MSDFPSEFRIGRVRIAPATVLAPMAGVTDTVFRRLIRNQGGCGLIMTEFTSSHGVVHVARSRLTQGQESHADVSLSVFRAGRASHLGATVRLRSAGDGRRRQGLPGFRLRYRRHQFRLPGEQSGQVQRRLGTAARSAAGGRDPAQGARGHLDSVHHEVPRRLERSGTGGREDGATGRRLRTASRGAASAHARAGLQRQGGLVAASRK